MSINNREYRDIERNDLVKKKGGAVYRVVSVLNDSRRDMVVCSQVNHPSYTVVLLVKDDISKAWKQYD